MKSAFDLAQVRLILRRGITTGRWTMEDLDQPPPGYVLFKQEWEKACRMQSQRLGMPVQYPCVEYKNLLRDDPPAMGGGTVDDF